MGNQNKLSVVKGSTSLPSILPEKLETILASSQIQITEYVNGLTPIKAYGGQLSNFIKTNPDDLFNAIEKLLAVLSLSLNVGKNLEPHQLAPLAKSIYGKYFFYSIDELALVLRMGKQGDLTEGDNGKLFNKLDEETIMIWFKIYDNRFRMPVVENKRGQDNKEMESENLNQVFTNLGGAEGINKIKESLSEEDQREVNYKAYRDKYFKK